MMNNGRPMGVRKTVQLLVILTILAWATQTLFHQWGYGAIIVPSKQALMAHVEPPATIRTIEVRPQIATSSEAVTLREVCRWSESNQAALSPYANVVVCKTSGKSITVDQIKSALRDAGVDLKSVQFSGAAMCEITAEKLVSPQASRELASSREALSSPVAEAPKTQPIAIAPTSQPQYFEEQLVLTRALSSGQTILKSDIATKRVPVDAPATQPVLEAEQLIGQSAARDLRAGETLCVDDVKPAQAIAAGQFMTVSLKIGPDQQPVETVAKAMNDGAPGDTIEAKNEATGEVYNVTITGPNAGQVIDSSLKGNDHGVATTDNGAN
jgi:flagella basal body P-ring formation protein FlgA